MPAWLLDGLETPVPVFVAVRGWNEDRFACRGMSVTFADDLRKPACRFRNQHGVFCNGPWEDTRVKLVSYIEFMAFDIFEVKTYGVLARLLLVNIADAMRSQVDLTILLVRQLELAASRRQHEISDWNA